MKYLLTYQLLLILHRQDYNRFDWLCSKHKLHGVRRKQHVVNHNRFGCCTNTELTAEDSLHPSQPANAPGPLLPMENTTANPLTLPRVTGAR